MYRGKMREIGRGIALILKLRIEVTALESRLNASFEHFEYIAFRIEVINTSMYITVGHLDPKQISWKTILRYIYLEQFQSVSHILHTTK